MTRGPRLATFIAPAAFAALVCRVALLLADAVGANGAVLHGATTACEIALAILGLSYLWLLLTGSARHP